MSLLAAVRSGESRDVLASLQTICDEQGLPDLAVRLAATHHTRKGGQLRQCHIHAKSR